MEVKKPPIPQQIYSDNQYIYYDAEYDSEYDSEYEYSVYDYEEDEDEIIPPPRKRLVPPKDSKRNKIAARENAKAPIVAKQNTQGTMKDNEQEVDQWDFISPEAEKNKAKDTILDLKEFALTPDISTG